MSASKTGTTLKIDTELYEAFVRGEEIEVMAPHRLNLMPKDEIRCGTEPYPGAIRFDAYVVSCGEMIGDYQRIRIKRFYSTMVRMPEFTSPTLWARHES